MRQVVALIFFAALLSGCATPVSVSQVRKAPEGSSKITVDMPYETVYRTIASESRRCFTRTLSSAAGLTVYSDLYTSTKTAEVNVIAGLSDTSIAEIVWDIRAIGESKTEITSSYRKKAAMTVDGAMQAWLKGDVTTCHVAT